MVTVEITVVTLKGVKRSIIGGGGTIFIYLCSQTVKIYLFTPLVTLILFEGLQAPGAKKNSLEKVWSSARVFSVNISSVLAFRITVSHLKFEKLKCFARNLLFKMAGESLFSLEVVVESVENICVSCYKPMIAFRLLDFPTVVIRSEHQGVFTNEKSYEIQSGKSCLFKMSKELLYERLQNTPLYIMLVDTASENTKLLASTTMSLVNCVRNILANIENNGLDIPAVSGSKGEFPMYNLMGSQVATVNLGYRMFSFGLGITGHVNLSLSKGIKRLEIKEIF